MEKNWGSTCGRSTLAVNSIQVIAIIIFYLFLTIAFVYDCLKKRKIQLGAIETTIVPMIVGIILLNLNLNWFFSGNNFILSLGLIFLIGGFLLGLIAVRDLGENKDDFWIAKIKQKKRSLITSGLYAKVRHPIYTAMLFYYGGLLLVFFHRITFLLYLLLIIILVYTAVAEEKFLQKRFAKYKDYSKITGRFFPKMKKRRQK